MSHKIGKPLTEETGKPRIPKTIPIPQPIEVPVKEPAKKEGEKVPVPVKSQPAYDAVAEQAYTAVEQGIQRTAKFLGISEQQVANLFIGAYAHVERIFRVGRVLEKTSTFETGWFDGSFTPTPEQWANATWEWVDEYNPSP